LSSLFFGLFCISDPDDVNSLLAFCVSECGHGAEWVLIVVVLKSEKFI